MKDAEYNEIAEVARSLGGTVRVGGGAIEDRPRVVEAQPTPTTYALEISPLEPFKNQLKRQGFHTTRKQRNALDLLDKDRIALLRLLSRGYLSDEARVHAAGSLASRVFDALGMGRK